MWNVSFHKITMAQKYAYIFFYNMILLFFSFRFNFGVKYDPNIFLWPYRHHIKILYIYTLSFNFILKEAVRDRCLYIGATKLILSFCWLKVFLRKTFCQLNNRIVVKQYGPLNALYFYPSEPCFYSCQKLNMASNLTKVYSGTSMDLIANGISILFFFFFLSAINRMNNLFHWPP